MAEVCLGQHIRAHLDEDRDNRHRIDGSVLRVEAAAAVVEDDDGERLIIPPVHGNPLSNLIMAARDRVES